jgi:MFS family permease
MSDPEDEGVKEQFDFQIVKSSAGHDLESTNEVSIVWARLVLFLCCVAYIFSSVGSGAIRVLQLDFEKIFSHTEMGLLYGAYGASATCMVLLVGPAIDRFGVAVCTFVCAFVFSLGFGVQVIGSYTESFVLIMIGKNEDDLLF